jgi:hypothetical protein
MEADKFWYLFLVFSGGLFVVFVATILQERADTSGRTLRLRPLVVLLKIALVQLSFYLILFLSVYSLDLATNEVFWASQCVHSDEYSFTSRRGWVSVGAYAASMIFSCVPLLGIVGKSRDVLDHTFTLNVLHFVVVSVYMRRFPASLSWWVVWGAGLVATSTFAEWLCYRFETMEYKASMGGGPPPQKDSKRVKPLTQSPERERINHT